MAKLPFNVASIIPTGVGASIGGFGGDAMAVLPLLSAICDHVITHPNAANAACFQKLAPNVLYVEGYALDQFFKGRWSLQPVRQNRIGILWDSGIPSDMEMLHQNTIAAVKTVYGVDIVDIAHTREPVNLQLCNEGSGRSAGRVENPDVLIECGQQLINKGATALAVCCLMPEVAESQENKAYLEGTGVDPIGGIEAMISHLLVSIFKLPCAHAPVFPYEEALPIVDHLVDPRAASEFIVSTFLPCVLTGLSKAPQYRPFPFQSSWLDIGMLSALLVPWDALGSVPVLSVIEKRIPVLGIRNNTTVMNCPSEALGIQGQVISCANYMEAMGFLLALKEGICLPEHFKTLANARLHPLNYAKA